MRRLERSLDRVADLDDLDREGFGLFKWDHGCHIRPDSVYAALTAFWKMERHSNVALAVIAGGKGSRLAGTAKGLLTLEGRPLLSRLLDLQSAFAEVLLVAREPAPYAAYSLRTVADVIPDRGAPGGVHTALTHARTEWVLAVGCDMPFVTRPALELLLSARADESDIIAFEINGRLEPLLALYRCAIAATWGSALSSHPSFRDLFRLFRTTLLSEEKLKKVDPEMRAIVSVNTPEDLVRFGVQLPDLGTAAP
jgi:molybdopterin-guanine dinucleotide biosynthesis protein A